MKVAFAYRKVGRGAAVPNYCRELARGFSSRFETWVFAREIRDVPAVVRAVRFPFEFRSRRLEYSANSLINLLLLDAYRARERFDILHTQDGDLVGGDIVTAHALLRVLFRFFNHLNPNHVAWLPRSPLLWSEDLVYRTRRYRHIIVTSEKLRDSLRTEYGIRGEDTTLVRLGVDPSVLRPDPSASSSLRANLSLPEGSRILLHVSTDFERKGLRTVLRCLTRLPREFVLIVAGKGHTAPFIDLARKLDVVDRIRFLGYVSNLERIYPAADLFLFPTQFDFFGYPVLEAMSCGVPPIVTADAGVAEIIRDGRNGLLVSDPDDDEELADRVRSADGGGDASQIGREARVTAEQTSVTRMIEETQRVYERVSLR